MGSANEETKRYLDRNITYYFERYPWFPGVSFVIATSIIFLFIWFWIRFARSGSVLGYYFMFFTGVWSFSSIVLMFVAGIYQLKKRMLIAGVANLLLAILASIFVFLFGLID